MRGNNNENGIFEKILVCNAGVVAGNLSTAYDGERS
jgi:hypothetical protein